MMNDREEILRMAREAGLRNSNPGMAQEALRFAAMVAATERDKAAAELQQLNSVNRDLLEVIIALEVIFSPHAKDSTAAIWIDKARAVINKATSKA